MAIYNDIIACDTFEDDYEKVLVCLDGYKQVLNEAKCYLKQSKKTIRRCNRNVANSLLKKACYSYFKRS